MESTTACSSVSGEVMLLNEEEKVLGDSGCFREECPDTVEKDLVDSDSRSDEESEGIAALLPSDLFEMEFNISLPLDAFDSDFNIEATLWIENFGSKTRGTNEDCKKKYAGGLYAEFSLVWSSSMDVEPKEGENEMGKTDLVTKSEDGLHDNKMYHNMEDLLCFGSEIYQKEHVKDCVDADGGAGPPADALFFALGYLAVKDLLTVEMVCKSLCEVVRNDPLLWRNILIEEYPMNYNITDDNLLQLTNRAQGSLSSLSLERCFKITNSCLKRLLESNLRLTKLSVPGCLKIRAEDVLRDLKVFNSVAKPGIKQLRIDHLSDMTNQLFEEFMVLLGADKDKSINNYAPRFYRPFQFNLSRHLYLSLDDERNIDIELCPKCQQVRQVYSCTTKKCQQEIQKCKACISCIDRCFECGCCFENEAYEETFNFYSICMECFFRSPLFEHKAPTYSVFITVQGA